MKENLKKIKNKKENKLTYNEILGYYTLEDIKKIEKALD